MKTGWYQNEKGVWYFFDTRAGITQGAMLTGWQWIDGYSYYFNTAKGSEGGLFVNQTTPDGYKVNSDGRWLNNESKPVYVANKGILTKTQLANTAKSQNRKGGSGGGGGRSSGGSSRSGGGGGSLGNKVPNPTLKHTVTVNYVFNGNIIKTNTMDVVNGANITLDLPNAGTGSYSVENNFDFNILNNITGSVTINIPLIHTVSAFKILPAPNHIVNIRYMFEGNEEGNQNIIVPHNQSINIAELMVPNPNLFEFRFEIDDSFDANILNNISGNKNIDIPLKKTGL